MSAARLERSTVSAGGEKDSWSGRQVVTWYKGDRTRGVVPEVL